MSLINEALKRASEAQVQTSEPPSGAPARSRAPKGVNDLPMPMMPVAAPSRVVWLPVVGIGLIIFLLLTASGFFFWKWWEERRAWVPYAETPPDPEPEAPVGPVTIRPTLPKEPPKVAATNPPVAVVPSVPIVPPAPPTTNPPVVTPLNPPPVVPPPKVALVPLPPPTPTPPSVAIVPPPVAPVIPVPPTNPPVVRVAVNTLTNSPSPVPPPTVRVPPTVPPATTKKGDPPVVKVAEVQFPDLKLQGIIKGKKKVTVLVNGKTITLGDRIDGATLMKIDSESVVFEKSGAHREVYVLR